MNCVDSDVGLGVNMGVYVGVNVGGSGVEVGVGGMEVADWQAANRSATTNSEVDMVIFILHLLNACMLTV